MQFGCSSQEFRSVETWLVTARLLVSGCVVVMRNGGNFLLNATSLYSFFYCCYYYHYTTTTICFFFLFRVDTCSYRWRSNCYWLVDKAFHSTILFINCFGFSSSICGCIAYLMLVTVLSYSGPQVLCSRILHSYVCYHSNSIDFSINVGASQSISSVSWYVLANALFYTACVICYILYTCMFACLHICFA